MHAPVFLKDRNRGTTKKFLKDTKEDILATIEFLYSRGMWSKYHYDKWKAEVEASNDEVYLHAFWDSIVSGAMFEDDIEEIYDMQKGLANMLAKE